MGALNTTKDNSAKKKAILEESIRNEPPRIVQNAVATIHNPEEYSAYARRKSMEMLKTFMPEDTVNELKVFATFAATDKTRGRLKASLLKMAKGSRYKCGEGRHLADEEAWMQQNAFTQLQNVSQPVARDTIDLTAIEDEAAEIARCQRQTAGTAQRKDSVETITKKRLVRMTILEKPAQFKVGGG
jgi:hypothetical protein